MQSPNRSSPQSHKEEALFDSCVQQGKLQSIVLYAALRQVPKGCLRSSEVQLCRLPFKGLFLI